MAKQLGNSYDKLEKKTLKLLLKKVRFKLIKIVAKIK